MIPKRQPTLSLGEERLFTFYAYPHFALARFAVTTLTRPSFYLVYLLCYA